ncbi:MAG: hypothetical protein A2751_04620 [Candidatus Doudnabacteria bacterium RIFCSPHIGHO2_01_FULL_46_14]|uniref:Uncharacterized protein n=1 Tax=Candidatus Doudnabacteria bacterium RIFCSPHIGHO2_01_FULL_46_14 TaxID=1817824 RepID=A0A1F5NNI3_9BACT|nr:MAG: hypothetical protein A2751_04620 [Candidatus Doudnabacteria bacterium RIFCSPHIGHO2_01_FULL_46_14]
MADELDLSKDFEGGFDADPIAPETVNPPSNPIISSMNEEIDTIQQPAEEYGFQVQEQRERIRGRFALYYIVGFMIIVVVALLISFFLLYRGKMEFENVTNMLVTISGILSGPLGFIIGYYFKAESND